MIQTQWKRPPFEGPTRALFDDLLQDMQGLVLRFDVATRLLPEQHPAKIVLEDALGSADTLLHDARRRIQAVDRGASRVEPSNDAG